MSKNIRLNKLLIAAAEEDNVDLAIQALKNGADPAFDDYKAFKMAACSLHLGVCKMILTHIYKHSPANRVIKKLGGYDAVADILNIKPATVKTWTYPYKSNLTVPRNYWPVLIEYAKTKNIQLTYDELNGERQ